MPGKVTGEVTGEVTGKVKGEVTGKVSKYKYYTVKSPTITWVELTRRTL